MLPEGWELDTLDNVAEIKGGYAFKSTMLKTKKDNYQLLRMGNIFNGILDLTRSPVYISEKDLSDKEKNFIINKDDILISLTGTKGKRDFGYAVKVRETTEPSLLLNQRLCSIIVDKIDSDYLFYFLQTNYFKNQFFLGSEGGTGNQVNVSIALVKNIKIKLPPLPEQRKIAAILRTWDEGIEKTEKLISINKKRLLILTRDLIFGYRFAGNQKAGGRKKYKWISGPESWKLVEIGDVALERSKLNSEGAQHTVLSCSKHDGFVRSLDFFKKQIFSKDLKAYKLIYRGDFGFPSNHVEEGSIGLQNLADIAVVSPIYIIFEPKSDCIDSDFLFRLLKTKIYADIFRSCTSSSVDRRGNLRWSEFSKIPLFLPELDEQRKISGILSKQQEIIDSLEKYKCTLISQKRGLMQKLLTGKWPVTT